MTHHKLLAKHPPGKGYLRRPHGRISPHRHAAQRFSLKAAIKYGAVGAFFGGSIGVYALWLGGTIVLLIGQLFWLISTETFNRWGSGEAARWCLRIGIIGGLLSGIIYGGYFAERNSHGIKY
ncbi:MAG TPA: hypothetical protein VI542_16270 [Candidatus Tectomicrobia bacterium]